MKTKKYPARGVRAFGAGVLGILFLSSLSARTQTLWAGPNITYTQCVSDNSNCVDQIIATVAITRGSKGPLYNSAPPYNETGPNGTSSPEDTLWAFLGDGQTLNDATNLSYDTFADIRNNADGDLAGVILNRPMVLQLVSEQIYISIEFTAWGQGGNGGFTYIRSTAPPPPPASLSAPKLVGGFFSFNYTANPGSTYVVQRSTNFTTWLNIATNVASTNLVLFSNSVSGSAPSYYRVGLTNQ